jgi:hypothetical protein
VPAALEPPFFRGGPEFPLSGFTILNNILILRFRRKNSGGRVQQDSLKKKK